MITVTARKNSRPFLYERWFEGGCCVRLRLYENQRSFKIGNSLCTKVYSNQPIGEIKLKLLKMHGNPLFW